LTGNWGSVFNVVDNTKILCYQRNQNMPVENVFVTACTAPQNINQLSLYHQVNLHRTDIFRRAQFASTKTPTIVTTCFIYNYNMYLWDSGLYIGIKEQ